MGPMLLLGHGNYSSPIVVADEEAELVRDMVEYLRKAFLPTPVSGHSTARDAAAVIARERPAVLICSLLMPRVGGMDLVTLARKRWGNLPTVILAGGLDLGTIEYAEADRHTIYLRKPFQLAALSEYIAELAGAPPRSLIAPLPRAVLADADTLTAGLEQRSVWGDVLHGAAEPPTVHRLLGAELAARQEDLSLSSETPLPPPSRGTPDMTGDSRGEGESWELLDEEIEIVEDDDGPSCPDNDRNGQAGSIDMALTTNNIKENLTKLEGIEGFMGAALADSDSGMCLGFLGGTGVINLEVAAAANTEVVRSKRKAIKSLNLRDEIEDILITLGKQYHLIRPVRSRPSLFFYLVLDRQRANLAMARFSLADAERELPM